MARDVALSCLCRFQEAGLALIVDATPSRTKTEASALTAIATFGAAR